MHRITSLLACSSLLGMAMSPVRAASDPDTGLTVPSGGQLAWHDDEIGTFFHINPAFPVGTMTFANFDPVALVDAAESTSANAPFSGPHAYFRLRVSLP